MTTTEADCMAKSKGKGGKLNKREKSLPDHLRRAVRKEWITRERAYRLVEAGGEAVEAVVPEPARPTHNVTPAPLRVNEVVLDWLSRRGHITRSQWEAGAKLQGYFEASGLERLRAMDPSRDVVDGGQHKPEPEFHADALTEFNRAVQVLDPWLYAIVAGVVLHDQKPEDCKAATYYTNERDRKTEVMTYLRNGLTKLAMHWRLPRDWE